MVAIIRPKMMVTAMAMKKASWSRGIMPSAVVRAAIATGRSRLTPASRMAVRASLLFFCSSISSISTMAFLIIMPDRLMAPSMAMKPKGWLVSSRPRVMPIRASGTVAQITAGWRRLLKSAITIRTMAPRKSGMLAAMAFWARPESRYSPHHSSTCPGGRGMASISALTRFRRTLGGTPFGSACTVSARLRFMR